MPPCGGVGSVPESRRRGVSSVLLINEVTHLLAFSEPCLENQGDSCPLRCRL